MKAKQLRDLAFKLHRYIGLAVGLLLVLTGLTGSLLVFHSEIDNLIITQQFGRVTRTEQSLSIDKILDLTKAAYPKWKPIGIEVPEDSDHPYKITMTAPEANSQIYLDGRYEVFINPYTGAILGDRAERYSLYRVTLNLHYRLFAEKTGRNIIGIAGLLLVTLSITGIMLWPGWKKLIPGFKIKWKAHPQRVNFDIHKVTGIISSIFIIIIAITGACYSFYELSDHLIYKLTFSSPPVTHVSQRTISSNPLKVSQILQQADTALEGGKTTIIYFPTSPEDTFWVYKKLPEESDELSNLLQLDQYSGKVLQLDTQQTKSLRDRIWDYIGDLHFGNFGGLKTRILYVFLGIIPLILFVTGSFMSYYRMQR